MPFARSRSGTLTRPSKTSVRQLKLKHLTALVEKDFLTFFNTFSLPNSGTVAVKMSFTSTCSFLIAIIFFLSNPSIPLASRRNSSGNVDLLTAKRPSSRRPRPGEEESASCGGLPNVPLLPRPSVTPSGYLWSVRAMMFLQILPDGKINGTLGFNPYAELNIESLGNCKVRIKGVSSQRYLVMEANGTLVSQTQPDEKKSIFSYQLQKDFYSFKNGKYFIAFKHGGSLKTMKAGPNGRSTRKSTRFVVLIERPPRRRRFPSGFNLKQVRVSSSGSRKLFGELQRR